MSNSFSIEELAASREQCYVSIDGERANPRAVTVGAVGQTAVGTSTFELCIGSVVLLHELREAEVVLTRTALLDFVREDIEKHGQQAVAGYLSIVQSVISPAPTRRRLFRLFEKRFSQPLNRWELRSIVEVVEKRETIVLRGTVEPVGGNVPE